MKRFITVLMSAMIALSMMPATAFAAISASNPVDISDAIYFLKNNLYNSSSLKSSTTYSVTEADTAISGDLKANYYVKVADVDEEIKSIQCGNNVFQAGDNFKLSVGRNVFIEDKAFYVDKGNLYVATVLVAPRNSILVNETELKLSLSPATTSLTASNIEKWEKDGDLSVTRGEGNSCTVEASGTNVTGALYIGINGADENTMFITEKTYRNGSTTYGLTGADSQGEEYGLAFYPFGYGRDLTNSSNVTAYDGNSLDYSIYAVGLGVCNATINYKVGGVKAEVNGVKYTSLKDAISADANGQTIKLLGDVTTTECFTINKGVTIDLNGHNITANDCRAFHITGGDVKITGEGTISSNRVDDSKEFDSSYSVIRVGDSNGENRNVALIIDKDVKVTSNHCYGLTVFGSKTKETVRIDGSVAVTGEAPAVSGNGSSAYGGTDITVNGIVSADNNNAIYHPQEGKLTINGTVTGEGGIEAKSGNTEVSIGDKAVITATATGTSHNANSNGCSSSGYAIAAVNNNAYTGNAKITIKGGQITGPINVLTDGDSTATASIEITGGVFSLNPKAYVAVGTNIYRQHAGKYFVGSMPASTSGFNAWALQGGVYEETYVAPAEPETPDAPVIDNSGSGDNASTNVDASASTVVKDDKAETSIDSTTGDKIVENAKENNVSEVVIKAETEKGEATGSTVALPEATVQALAKDTEASVTIKTDNATVTLDKDAVKATAEQAGTDEEVKLEVVTVENTEDTLKVELKLVTSKGTVTDFKGGIVTVTVPVDPELAKKDVVCVYIDNNDKYTKMEGALSADKKTYTFTTGHFSTYAILEEAEADAEIIKQTVKVGTANVKLYTAKGGKLRVKASAKNATGYKVYYKKSTWKNYKTYTKGNIKTLDKTFKKLSKGKYTVKVKAYYKDYAGTKVVVPGAASKAKTITVKK